MAQPREKSLAFAAVIQSVFVKGFGKGIAGGGADRGNGEVGPKSLAIALGTLLPLRRRVVGLTDARGNASRQDGIGAEGVKQIILNLCFFGWPPVGHIRLAGRAGG